MFSPGHHYVLQFHLPDGSPRTCKPSKPWFPGMLWACCVGGQLSTRPVHALGLTWSSLLLVS